MHAVTGVSDRFWARSILAVALLGTAPARADADAAEFERLLRQPPPDRIERSESPERSSRPTPRAVRPATVTCEARFISLRARSDRLDAGYLQACFYQERCSTADKCRWALRNRADFAALHRLAARCGSLPGAPAHAEKFARWTAATAERIAMYCGAR